MYPMQATVLDLYDPGRSAALLKGGQIVSWEMLSLRHWRKSVGSGRRMAGRGFRLRPDTDERACRRICRRGGAGARGRAVAQDGRPAHRGLHALPGRSLDGLLAQPTNFLPALVFAARILGLAGGFLLQWYGAAVSDPRNIGGRPLASWPAFILIAFEIAVLCSVLAGFVGFFRGGAAAGAVSADRCTARF